ncbi:MAG: flagellar hook basal-body protein [bacterium]
MGTLQGIIFKATENASKQLDALGYLTTNVANYNTVGYKSQRFENYLEADGRIQGKVRTDYSNGELLSTKRTLDIAIDGTGFIPVTRKDGLVAYTRDGSFSVNAEGYLVTQDGFLVADGIKIPANYYNLKFMEDGTIKVMREKDLEPEVIGKIPLITFNDPENLESIEGNKLVASEKSGKPILLKDHENIKQGKLERSNVNIFNSVNDVLIVNGSIISSTRLMKVMDEIYRQSVNLRQ